MVQTSVTMWCETSEWNHTGVIRNSMQLLEFLGITKGPFFKSPKFLTLRVLKSKQPLWENEVVLPICNNCSLSFDHVLYTFIWEKDKQWMKMSYTEATK